MPRDDFPNLNTKSPDGLRPGGKPYRVIVAESRDFQRKLIVQILESEQYHVVAQAENGRDALNKLDALDKPVDLITTELDMPVLDGYAMLYELNQRSSRPIVVFVSEETTKGVMQDLIKMGISDYILKPIDRRVFLERLKNVIKRHNI